MDLNRSDFISLRRGDPAQLRRFYLYHEKPLYAYILACAGDGAVLAGEVFSETFRSAFHSISALRSAAGARSWLLKIALRRLADHRGNASFDLVLDRIEPDGDGVAFTEVPDELRNRVLAFIQEAKRRPFSLPLFSRILIAFLGAAALVIAFYVLRSCSPSKDSAAEFSASAVTTDLARGFTRLPFNRALIVYMAGDVEIFGPEGALRPADVGDYLAQGERIKTGASSSCEIQLDADSLIVVEEKSDIVIDDFDLRPLSSDIAISVVSGESLHKVEKIADLGSYVVKTPAASCFVRRGRFMAAVRDSRETAVALGEGSVFLNPADGYLFSRGRGAWKANSKIAELMEGLPYRAPAVAVGREVVVGSAPGRDSQDAASRLDEELKRALSLKRTGASDIARLGESASAYLLSIQGRIKDSRALSSLTAFKLEWLDRLPVLPLAREKTQVPAKSSLPAIALIEVTVEPKDAIISLYGQPVGKKAIRALAAETLKLEFDARLPGYEDASLAVQASSTEERSFHIILKPIPNEISTPTPRAKKIPSPAPVSGEASPEVSPPPSPAPSAGSSDAAPATFDLLIEYGGHRYYISRETMTWQAAKEKCDRMGGHLVTLTSIGESRAIVKALNRRSVRKEVWIGLADEAREGNWIWVTGEKLSYSDWFSGEPNDNLNLEDWALLTRQRGDVPEDGDGYRWNDVNISTQALYILEMD
jgi:hypothetical protein